MENTINPFAIDVDKDHLYDIGSGKCASKETKDFLLHVHENGTKLKKAFTSECLKDPNRCEKNITLQKLHRFASEEQKYKIKANEKLVVVKMERDLSGRILLMSLQHQIDVGELFKFPLTPVPLSLCHVDGSMLKTQKSKLLRELEQRIVATDLGHVDVTIVDGMFFCTYLKILPCSWEI